MSSMRLASYVNFNLPYLLSIIAQHKLEFCPDVEKRHLGKLFSTRMTNIWWRLTYGGCFQKKGNIAAKVVSGM